jgi:hypothetical protein
VDIFFFSVFAERSVGRVEGGGREETTADSEWNEKKKSRGGMREEESRFVCHGIPQHGFQIET